MNLIEFKRLLAGTPAAKIRFVLPDHSPIPPHFHITEVGHVHKNFVDCGGTRRSASSCVLQAWVAKNDEDHVLLAGKLAHILELADDLFPQGDLPVEVEFESRTISQFPLASVKQADGVLTFQLASKHTDCLAKEACGLESDPGCGSGEGCCG